MTATAMQITASHHAFSEVAALFDDYRVHYGQPPSPRSTHDWLSEQLAEHRMKIAAAVHSDEVRGFITTTVMPASLMLGTTWSIRDLYVPSQHRRCGIARTLLRYAIDNARAAGAYRLSLQTEPDNTPALALYTTAGFQPVTGLELLSLALAPNQHQDPRGAT